MMSNGEKTFSTTSGAKVCPGKTTGITKDFFKVWSAVDRIVHGESCMFAGSRQANLLFPIKRILRVFQPQENRIYQEGVDYLWTPGSNQLALTENSSIPALTREELSPSKETAILYPKPGNNAITGGPNQTLLLFDNADFFARHQVEVDYEAETIDFPEFLADQSDKLPRIRRKLAEGKPVEVVYLGDSISDGFNATRFVGIPPFNPPWTEQFVAHLQNKYGSPVQYRNFAINGSNCISAIDTRRLWIERKPDLLFIAFGGNDVGLGTEVYVNALRLLISLARLFNPEVEILLVATTAGNSAWKTVPSEKRQEQHDSLMKLVADYGTDTAVANVYDIWQECVRRKGYYSMTGNGVNHPNDFGHKLFMATLEKIL